VCVWRNFVGSARAPRNNLQNEKSGRFGGADQRATYQVRQTNRYNCRRSQRARPQNASIHPSTRGAESVWHLRKAATLSLHDAVD